MPAIQWLNVTSIPTTAWTCGYCGAETANDRGFEDSTHGNKIPLCPRCWKPTYFASGSKVGIPAALPGESVGHLPADIETLYTEARKCIQAGAFTAGVSVCRTILSHVAVEEGAKAGETFGFYVDYLDSNGHIPPRGKAWVDYIRKRGNDAVHKIQVMNQEEAALVLTFTTQLLRNIYEIGNLLPKAP